METEAHVSGEGVAQGGDSQVVKVLGLVMMRRCWRGESVCHANEQARADRVRHHGCLKKERVLELAVVGRKCARQCRRRSNTNRK
jgi:hypothetical protein